MVPTVIVAPLPPDQVTYEAILRKFGKSQYLRVKGLGVGRVTVEKTGALSPKEPEGRLLGVCDD